MGTEHLGARPPDGGSADMTIKLSILIGAVGLLLGAAAVSAHHSFSAEYDATKPVTLKGTLTKMEWMNPHGWIYIDVKGPDGKVVNWAIETGAPNALLRRGIRQTDFPPGMQVVIDGYLAKSGLPMANARKVKLADGRDFFLGTSGNGAPADGAEPQQEKQ